MPTCHPSRPHHARGLCQSCYIVSRYGAAAKERNRRLYKAKPMLKKIERHVIQLLYNRAYLRMGRANWGKNFAETRIIIYYAKKLRALGYAKLLDRDVQFTWPSGAIQHDNILRVVTLIESSNENLEQSPGVLTEK